MDPYDCGPNEVKLRIPHPPGEDLVGILHQRDSSRETRGQPLVLILHGVLAHKNQTFHRGLAARLGAERGWDSFRYDLRGQGAESVGKWGLANFDDDVSDLERVISYLELTYGYELKVIVGHSRGSLISSYYLCTRPLPTTLTHWVNASGRFYMNRGSYFPGASSRPTEAERKEGWDWNVRVASRPVTRRVTLEEARSFAEWDNSYITTRFPEGIEALTVHAEDDLVVPVEDAHMYHAALSNRNKGSHTLRTFEAPAGGHNFLSPWTEPTGTIMDWLEGGERGVREERRRARGASESRAGKL